MWTSFIDGPKLAATAVAIFIPFCLRGKEGFFVSSLWHKDARNPFLVPLIPSVCVPFVSFWGEVLSDHASVFGPTREDFCDLVSGVLIR